MIPADLASRLKILLESSVQPVTPAPAIPAGLPRFELGERFSALIQSALPDGSFQAIVAGRTVTLALPEAVRSGDVLELIVTAQKGDTIYARQTPVQNGILPAETQSRPILSQTGQLISHLLTGRFGSQEATPLQRSGQPLINAPPNSAEFARVLREAVSQSGLFYESHLRQWTDGKLPLASVMQEPQAQQPPLQHSLPTGTAPPTAGQVPPLQTLPEEPGQAAESAAGKTETALIRRNTDGSAPHPEDPETSMSRADGADSSSRNSTVRQVADSLMPIVQRQLDTLATHQMSWQGQVWPGVQMQWNIFDPEHPDSKQSAQGDADDETAQFWRSSLRLNMPNLGNVDVRLILGPQGLTLNIETDRSTSAEDMRTAGPRLHEALQSSGVELLQLKVSQHDDT